MTEEDTRKEPVYKTRFRKSELARALDNKYQSNLISPSGTLYTVALRRYFFSYTDLITELNWAREDYNQWAGYIDPQRAIIICRHLEVTVEDFD